MNISYFTEFLTQERFLFLGIITIFGAIMGSFATALIYRLPRDINWVSKRSECTICNHKLGVLDLIPIFSYIISRGKCRYCGTKYGFTYFIIEALVAISFFISFYFLTIPEALITGFLAFAIIILSAIDFEHYIIPDEVNIFIFVLGAINSYVNNLEISDFAINCFTYLGISLLLRWSVFLWKKREGLGLGDVKLFLASGAFLSIELLPIYLFLSGFSGLILAIFWRLFKKSEIFPFGPCLSFALLLCVIFPQITNWLNYFLIQNLN
ncbi:MAG: prepilin peptidase [Rickettsiales bacterium]|nr:prepilin peptidase [Rickettsiales bacterium]